MTLHFHSKRQAGCRQRPRMSGLTTIAIGLALISCATGPTNAPAPPAVTSPAPIEAEPPSLMTWGDLLSGERPSPSVSIDHGDQPTDIVDLWLPKGDGPHPVVLMIHGGCWQKEIADRTLMNYAAEALRQEGFAVWNIEYRGVDEEGGGYPGTFLDVARAADLIELYAEPYELDLETVIAYGHSAGGHLAMWLAARSRLPEASPVRTGQNIALRGVVNTGGLADLEASAPVTLPSCLGEIIDTLTGPPSPQRPDVFSDTSPATLFPLGVRQININGDRDRIAPPALGKAITARAQESSDQAMQIVVSNTGHVELIAPGTAAFDATIAALLYLAGKAPNFAD